MNRFDILFETDRFNVSQVKEHFINPCCFGEDVAQWLREKLAEKGAVTGTPGQEDFVGVTGFHKEGALNANEGEWRIMVKKDAQCGISFEEEIE